jgi:iron uptake system component EfeO
VALTPQTLVSAAGALVKQVAARKLAGTEDRYSHTDLSDLAANLEGAQAILRTLTPVLQAKNSGLYNSLLRNFGGATATLARYRLGASYRPYTALTGPDKQALTGQLNALAADWVRVGPALGV